MKLFRYLPYLLLMSFIVLSSCKSDDSSGGDDTEEPNPNAGNLLSVGDSAADLLGGTEFDAINIELVFVENFNPRAATVDNLRIFLEERLNKPGGITITERSIDPIGMQPFSTAEIAEIEDQVRTVYNQGSTLGVFIFFTDGANINDTQFSKTLGTAYRNTSLVIYEETIREFSDEAGEPGRVALESTTLNHEFAHLLGLVNLGTPLTSDHEDPINTRHCVVEDCLMFFQTEIQGGVFKMKSLDAITPLDPLCIADLQANGGL
ncbi:membrane metalloprotease [Gilvibacter sediminis]|uniref:membrane metalloprotease n=1 Tax=Gilvibacter sediminis TaxID=379071 RepID=UPI00235053B6|nr:membrane metalloprotease [Gilvibacter sediminis]MDC7998459.1 membrane metalloprotease [Gilvibacter sediminis]